MSHPHVASLATTAPKHSTRPGYSYTSREVSSVETVQASSMLQREEFGEDTDTSLVSFNLTKDTRDDARFPKRGQITGGALEFAGLGGLNQFLRMRELPL